MVVKRSMAVYPAPIDLDGDETSISKHPSDSDRRWEGHYSYDRRWTGCWGYRIKRVTNSVEYRPGWLLNKARVNKLINDGWTVSVLSKG